MLDDRGVPFESADFAVEMIIGDFIGTDEKFAFYCVMAAVIDFVSGFYGGLRNIRPEEFGIERFRGYTLSPRIVLFIVDLKCLYYKPRTTKKYLLLRIIALSAAEFAML